MAKILIVDDEAALLSSIKRTLRDTAHELEFALDGKQALHMLTSGNQHYDLLISDVYMPFDGMELLSHLTKQGINIPVIMMSGGDRRNGSLNMLNLLDAFNISTKLCKPFSNDELINAIDYTLMKVANES